MLRSTNSRLRAQQSWPVLAKTLMGEVSAAFCQSASAKTILGDLPPNSSEMRFMSRVADGFPDLHHLELREGFKIVAQSASDVEQNFGAFAWSEIAPTGFPHFVRGFDSDVHVSDICRGNFGD